MTTANPIPVPRPLRGSRIDVFYPVKPENIPSLSSLESAFQLQEYISLVIRLDVHDVDRIVSIPGKNNHNNNGNGKGASGGGDEADTLKVANVDEACWIYEQLRRLAQDLTHPLITNLQTECTRQSCPEMKAGEWLYLCVAHGNDGGMEQCCAIDYILHTIDSATALLNSPRAFPSRLSIPTQSHRHFSSLARRLGRIFAHAYFHHRALFEQAEAESSLYRRFEEIVARWNLVPREFLVVPSREENGEMGRGEPKLAAAAVVPTILSHDDDISAVSDSSPSEQPSALNPQNMSPPQPEDDSKSGFSSPGRRVGRNRTDTMVFSDASAIVEGLSKSPAVHPTPDPEPELGLEPGPGPEPGLESPAPQEQEQEPQPEPEQEQQQQVETDIAATASTADEDNIALSSSSDNTGVQESEEEGPGPVVSIDEVADKSVEDIPPSTSEVETELSVITPSSSTAPSESLPLDFHIVRDPPKEEEHPEEPETAAAVESAPEPEPEPEMESESVTEVLKTKEAGQSSEPTSQAEETLPESEAVEPKTDADTEGIIETASDAAPPEPETVVAEVAVEIVAPEDEVSTSTSEVSTDESSPAPAPAPTATTDSATKDEKAEETKNEEEATEA